MKKINFQPSVLLVLIAALCVSLFSFTNRIGHAAFPGDKAGGEGFEIYLNNKLVLQQFGKEMNTVKTIFIEQVDGTSQLAIRYFHCGQAGKSRVIAIKDEQHRVLKEWRFNDNKDAGVKLCCNVKDIMTLPKLKTGDKAELYYTSAEIPGGRLLAEIQTRQSGNANP